MTRVICLNVVVLWALLVTGCSTNLATGQRQLNIISTQREIALGAQASPKFLSQYGGQVPSRVINRYVSDLGNRLAAQSERPDLPWQFHVVDSQVINAFALPGGKVFISRGLISQLDNEAQLAGTLGHEIGHVTAQHIGQQMTRALLLQGIAVGLGIAGEVADKDFLRVLGLGTSAGGAVYLLKFSRDQESQADELGVRYMTRLGYNPQGQVQLMQVLDDAQGDKRPGLEMLASHPLPKTRIKRLQKHIAQTYPDSQSPGVYRFGAQAFRETVLDELNRLPPPKHH